MSIKSFLLLPFVLGSSLTLLTTVQPDTALANPKYKDHPSSYQHHKSKNYGGYDNSSRRYGDRYESWRGYDNDHDDKRSRRYPNYPRRQTYQSWLNIPPGHLPPPGYGRFWYPGRPPGQQPRPFPCHEDAYRRYNAPYGSYLVYTPISEPRYIRVVTYERDSSDARVGRAVIEVFEVLTGQLIRVIGS